MNISGYLIGLVTCAFHLIFKYYSILLIFNTNIYFIFFCRNGWIIYPFKTKANWNKEVLYEQIKQWIRPSIMEF